MDVEGGVILGGGSDLSERTRSVMVESLMIGNGMDSASFGEFTSVEVCGVSNPSKEEVEDEEDRKPLRLFCPDSIGDEWVCGREAVRGLCSDSNVLGPRPESMEGVGGW